MSFGERNAFSLVLFMYDVLKENPDLIILDDPISSFDKNKKYAIIDALFRSEKKSLRSKTVLLLTHDFEPILDMLYHHGDRFIKPYATFIENKRGQLIEKEIKRIDIKSFVEIAKINNDSQINLISRLVYLRRLYEIQKSNNIEFQLISNLFHKREKPNIRFDGGEREMTMEEFDHGSNEIKKLIPDFDYQALLKTIKDDEALKKIYSSTISNYEKLHLHRIIFDDKPNQIESSIIMKFINESFHIENSYIYQLNPREYPLVPQYVIDECDKAIEAL